MALDSYTSNKHCMELQQRLHTHNVKYTLKMCLFNSIILNYNNFSYHFIPIYLITLVILEYQLIENIH